MPLPDIASNPLVFLSLTISVPLAVFFFFMFRFLFPRWGVRMGKQNEAVQPQQGQGTQPQAQPQAEPPREDPTKPLLARMDKMQGELIKAQKDGVAELKEAIQALATSIEDTALAVKSAQSDRASPFNVVPMEEVKESPAGIGGVSMSGVNLPKFIQMCALLEAMEYDNDRIRDLYDLSLLTSDDMELLTRIQEFLANSKGRYRAKDLALTAYHIAETYKSSSPEMRKFLLTIRGVGDGQ
ncbi:hypothetical protein GCM10007116_04510 [Sulfodiicoccus acidiphilus]|nr:hypothetical protein [Sulfodiicoccus acidiphilus]GGT89761.1 hypothetical protein GCM10007116_04510 [Sulfodiicoccus acidiphilus]